VLGPHRSAVERLQGVLAGGHVGEGPDPDEPVRVIDIAELPEDPTADSVLALDEVLVEQRDQVVAPAGHQGVLPQLEHALGVSRHRHPRHATGAS
jgi:hypothetical protein